MQLNEQRIREIVREEVTAFFGGGAADQAAAKIPQRNDKHYEAVREVVDALTKRKLLIHEAYTVLEQAKAVLGYTRL